MAFEDADCYHSLQTYSKSQLNHDQFSHKVNKLSHQNLTKTLIQETSTFPRFLQIETVTKPPMNHSSACFFLTFLEFLCPFFCKYWWWLYFGDVKEARFCRVFAPKQQRCFVINRSVRARFCARIPRFSRKRGLSLPAINHQERWHGTACMAISVCTACTQYIMAKSCAEF